MSVKTVSGALISFCAILFASQSRAQPLSPYSEFQGMSLAALGTLQVKLTYVGNQHAGIGTVLFGANGSSLNAGLFIPFRRRERTYSNDDVAQQKFTASVQELKAMIDSVATLPDVTDGDIDPGGTVSFSLLSTAGDTTRVFEAVVNNTTGRGLFGELLAAFKSNASAKAALRSFGCPTGMLPASPPVDVGSQVQVKASGLRADRASTGQYVGKVRVSNTSKATIAGPLVLVAVIRADAQLIGADGVTCNIEPPGHPFVNLLVSGGLAPGANIERTLRFLNPSGTKLNVDFKVFGGTGTP